MALQFENNSFGPGNKQKPKKQSGRPKKLDNPLANALMGGTPAASPMGGTEMDFDMPDMGGMQMNAPSPTGGGDYEDWMDKQSWTHELDQNTGQMVYGPPTGKFDLDPYEDPSGSSVGGGIDDSVMGAQPTGMAGFSGAASLPYTTDPSTGPNIRYWDDPQPRVDPIVDPKRGFINTPTGTGLEGMPTPDYSAAPAGRSGYMASPGGQEQYPYEPIDWPTDGDGRKMVLDDGRQRRPHNWYGQMDDDWFPRDEAAGPILGMRGGQQGQQGDQLGMRAGQQPGQNQIASDYQRRMAEINQYIANATGPATDTMKGLYAQQLALQDEIPGVNVVNSPWDVQQDIIDSAADKSVDSFAGRSSFAGGQPSSGGDALSDALRGTQSDFPEAQVAGPATASLPTTSQLDEEVAPSVSEAPIVEPAVEPAVAPAVSLPPTSSAYPAMVRDESGKMVIDPDYQSGKIKDYREMPLRDDTPEPVKPEIAGMPMDSDLEAEWREKNPDEPLPELDDTPEPAEKKPPHEPGEFPHVGNMESGLVEEYYNKHGKMPVEIDDTTGLPTKPALEEFKDKVTASSESRSAANEAAEPFNPDDWVFERTGMWSNQTTGKEISQDDYKRMSGSSGFEIGDQVNLGGGTEDKFSEVGDAAYDDFPEQFRVGDGDEDRVDSIDDFEPSPPPEEGAGLTWENPSEEEKKATADHFEQRQQEMLGSDSPEDINNPANWLATSDGQYVYGGAEFGKTNTNPPADTEDWARTRAEAASKTSGAGEAPEVYLPPDEFGVGYGGGPSDQERRKADKMERDDYDLSPGVGDNAWQLGQDEYGDIDSYNARELEVTPGTFTREDLAERDVAPELVQQLVNKEVGGQWGDAFQQALSPTARQGIGRPGMTSESGNELQTMATANAMLGGRMAQEVIPHKYALEHSKKVKDMLAFANQEGIDMASLLKSDWYSGANDLAREEAINQRIQNAAYGNRAQVPTSWR